MPRRATVPWGRPPQGTQQTGIPRRAEGAEIALPIPKTIATLLLITIVPVSIGMVVRSKAPGFAKKTEKAAGVLSLLFLFLFRESQVSAS